MATAQTQIRIDTNIKKEAVSLFSSLGLDMSSAVNLLLHQCILHGGLPFAVELPDYSKKFSNASAVNEKALLNQDAKRAGCTDDPENVHRT